MNSNVSSSGLRAELQALGIAATDIEGGFIRLDGYPIQLGRYKGQAIDLAMLVPDYPLTPPAGIHMHVTWPRDREGISDSPLGPGWLYYSRQLTGWLGRSNPHEVLAYINRVLADA